MRKQVQTSNNRQPACFASVPAAGDGRRPVPLPPAAREALRLILPAQPAAQKALLLILCVPQNMPRQWDDAFQ